MDDNLEQEQALINSDKIYEFINDYKIPLTFTVLAVFLMGTAIFLWQSSNSSDKISFSQEETEAGPIKVDIEGAVLRPGVYELLSGSRISDLLIKAGGLTAEADREWVSKTLNLAAKLADGGKVYIPTKNTTNTTNTTNNSININTATASELDTLPGVGPVTAQKIIDGRTYQTVEELLSRKIVGQSTFEKIKGSLSVY